MYAHSDEQDEVGVIGLNGVNVEFNPGMEALLGVCEGFGSVLDPLANADHEL
jgi:hypothetical protein